MSDSSRDTAGPATGGPGSGRPSTGRYLIGGDPAILATLSDRWITDPRVRVIRAPATGPLTIEAAPEVVDELREAYADRLVVEPDLRLAALPPVGPEPTGEPGG